MTTNVYMLRCVDGRYFVGSTDGVLEKCVADHNAGTDEFTAQRLPVELKWSQAFEQADDAVATEQRLKGWSRAKKEALIDGTFAELRPLARPKPKAAAEEENPDAASDREEP